MNTPLAKWSIFIALALIWGSSFILMKRGLEVFSFVEVGLLRIVLASLMTLSFAFPSIKEFHKKDFWPLLAVGLFGNGIPYFLFPIALTHLDSSIVGITNSLVPLFTVLIGMLFFGFIARKLQLWGILVGLSGAIWLLAPWQAEVAASDLVYGLFPILATIQYAFSINIISRKLAHLSSNAITLLGFATIFFPASLALLFFTDFITKISTHPNALNSFGYVAILGIVGTSLAVVFFNKLIKSTSAIFASSITYCVPIVAVIWGFVDGETIGIRHGVGIAGILTGVYLVNVKRTPRDFFLKSKKTPNTLISSSSKSAPAPH